MKRLLLIGACVAGLLSASPAQAKVLDIQETVTPAGIRLWLARDQSLPVMALSFSFRGGAARDDQRRQGLAQLLSNTLDEGAGDMKSEAFQEALRDNAIELSFDAGRDEFSGALRTLSSNRDLAAKLLKAALQSPRFDAEAVGRMKQANLTRIRANLGDADWIAARLFNDALYKGHPYALNTGGTLKTMAAFTPADLRAEAARLFARDALVVGVAGDIDMKEAARLVDGVFGALPAKSAAAPLADIGLAAAGRPVFYAKEQPLTALSMGWPGIDLHDPDYYAMQVMNYIFGGGSFSSRLMEEVREKRGLTYGISSYPVDLDHADRFVVSASMLPGNVAPVMALIEKTADDLKTADVGADELRAAKDYLTGSLPLSLSSSLRIADTLAAMQRNERPITALDDYRAKIEAVTAADIRRAAARIFAAPPVVVLVGARPEGLELDEVKTVPNAEKGG